MHVHACFKLGGSRSGSKQDRHAEPAAETQAAQGTRLGEGKAEGGTAAGRGVGGVRSPGEVGRVCSTCGLAGTELKECAECHSTWCCVPACSLVREMLDGTPARKRPPTAPPSLHSRTLELATMLKDAGQMSPPSLHSRPRPATATTGRYCSKDCQRIHWKSGHKHECEDLKTLHDLQAEFAEMQGLSGFENYDPLHPPTDMASLSAP